MLTISTKSKYGLKAVLALAENFEQGLLQTKDIAAQQDIPRQYLEQIFNQLGKANIISSVRGKYGGYKLARSPAAIHVAEIINLLEGGIKLATASVSRQDVINELFHDAEEKLLKAFEVSLAELLTRQQQCRSVLSFDI